MEDEVPCGPKDIRQACDLDVGDDTIRCNETSCSVRIPPNDNCREESTNYTRKHYNDQVVNPVGWLVDTSDDVLNITVTESLLQVIVHGVGDIPTELHRRWNASVHLSTVAQP